MSSRRMFLKRISYRMRRSESGNGIALGGGATAENFQGSLLLFLRLGFFLSLSRLSDEFSE